VKDLATFDFPASTISIALTPTLSRKGRGLQGEGLKNFKYLRLVFAVELYLEEVVVTGSTRDKPAIPDP